MPILGRSSSWSERTFNGKGHQPPRDGRRPVLRQRLARPAQDRQGGRRGPEGLRRRRAVPRIRPERKPGVRRRKLKSAAYDTTQGFGLRAVSGEVTGFSHASALDEKALKRAADTVKAVRAGKGGVSDESPRGTNRRLYADDNPIDGEAFEKKVKLLQEIDAYVRAKEPKARQVSISLSGSWQVVEIIRAGGWRAADVRPLVRLNVSVVCADGSRMEAGSTGSGRRAAYGDIFHADYWKKEADEAIRQALVNLDSIAAPAGEMPVVLGSGWSGVLWHEAVGHGLEGDFHR